MVGEGRPITCPRPLSCELTEQRILSQTDNQVDMVEEGERLAERRSVYILAVDENLIQQVTITNRESQNFEYGMGCWEEYQREEQ